MRTYANVKQVAVTAILVFILGIAPGAIASGQLPNAQGAIPLSLGGGSIDGGQDYKDGVNGVTAKNQMNVSWNNDEGDMTITKIERFVNGSTWVTADVLTNFTINPIGGDVNGWKVTHKTCENFWEAGKTYRVHYTYNEQPTSVTVTFV